MKPINWGSGDRQKSALVWGEKKAMILLKEEMAHFFFVEVPWIHSGLFTFRD